MKAAVAVASTTLAAVVLSAPAALAADECRGLQVCIPVAGPWVVIPAPSRSDRYADASWRLRCPRGSIVGGVDARLSERTIDVTFTGLPGSPVNPGITTTNEVVFRGVYTGKTRHATTFRPFIGCIPVSGGGRIPTAVRAPAAVKPGRPTILRVRSLDFRAGTVVTVAHACARGERLVSSTQNVGLRMRRQPTTAQLAGVRSALVRRGGRVVARAGVRGKGLKAKLQVRIVCTRGGGTP